MEKDTVEGHGKGSGIGDKITGGKWVHWEVINSVLSTNIDQYTKVFQCDTSTFIHTNKFNQYKYNHMINMKDFFGNLILYFITTHQGHQAHLR